MMLLFKNRFNLVKILFIYSSFSVPPKVKEYPGCAKSARTLTTTVTWVLYSLLTHPLLSQSSAEHVPSMYINDHALHKNSFEN
jgi:hypothetical protein